MPRAGQTLPGVQLSGSAGHQLALDWTADSLLARALRPGSTLDLVAEYPTEAGRVTGERLAGVRVPAGTPASLRLTLPEQLANAPTGPVCLRLRQASGTALPIRGAGAGATDGFRFPSWERQASANAQRQSIARELAALEQAGQRDAAWMEQFAQWRQGARVGTAQSCEALSPEALHSARPRQVLEPARQAEAARTECAWRWTRTAGDGAGTLTADMARLFSEAAQEAERQRRPPGELALLRQRSTQARQLQAHLSAFEALPGAARYQPLLIGSGLRLGSAIQAQLKTGVNLPVAAGILDAYGSCLRDTQDQLRIALETWQREQDPRLLQGRLDIARSDCRARFAQATQVAERTRQRTERAALLQARQAGLQDGPPSAGTASEDLAAHACTAA